MERRVLSQTCTTPSLGQTGNLQDVMRPIATFVVCFALVTACHGRAPNATGYEREFHSVIPLGAERIDLHPADRNLYILATAESPGFEGWHTREDGSSGDKSLLSADGTPVKFYPSHVDFRLTATAMRPDLLLIDSYGTLNLAPAQINQYLLGLTFKLLIFHGLDVTTVEPDSIRMIGMPAEVEYDERTWRASFSMPRPVPTDDHIVLEVLSPTGIRLCKFHLDFF